MRRATLLTIACALILSFPRTLLAVGSAGFENASFSARSLGQGNAVTARPDEPASISYNPAGLTDLPGIQVQPNISFISAITRITNEERGTAQSTGTLSPVPTGYVSINPGDLLGNRVAFGVGSDSPFGLSTKYQSNQPYVHYTGYSNWLKMYTIKPVMTVKLANWLSIGGGPMYYRIFDFGTVHAYPNVLLGAPFPDGQLRVNMAGNSWGWNLGALVKPHKQHQLGFYFRSPVMMTIKGLGKVENATIGGNFETGVYGKIALPLNFTFAYAYKPTEKLEIETDFGYTRWSIFDRLYVNADPVNAADDAIMRACGQSSGNDRDYGDSFSIHLGGKYKFTNKFTVRAGTFFYTAAEPKTHLRPQVPDANRLGMTLGFGYDVRKDLALDVSYLFEFALRRHVNNEISEVLGTTVDGTYFSVIQGLYLSMTYKWDGLCRPKPACGDAAVNAELNKQETSLPVV